MKWERKLRIFPIVHEQNQRDENDDLGNDKYEGHRYDQRNITVSEGERELART